MNLVYYDESILLALASAVGHPIKVDNNMKDFRRDHFACVCIDVDLTKPVVGRVAREYFNLACLERDYQDRLFIYVDDALNTTVPNGFSGVVVDLFSKGSLIPKLQDLATWRMLGGDVTVEFMLRYTSSGKSSTYVGMMVESFGSIGSLAIKICVIITNLGVLIIYFIILGDVLCGNESNDIAHLGILQDWFGINWLTSRAFALLFVALFIMVPLVMLRRVALVFVVICSSMAISALLSGKSQTPRIVPDFSQVTVIYLFTTIPVFVMGSDSMPMSFYSLVIDYQIVVIDYQ
ncbi:hypothetical protein JHK86_055648 [Glycine max]|uniref:Uncharacterized protein n=1 Tax=Glycine max TaxID=3847 RepID=K7N2B2_SOYBN|nr:hypothetical protein JHK86_055648 [Glycine max]